MPASGCLSLLAEWPRRGRVRSTRNGDKRVKEEWARQSLEGRNSRKKNGGEVNQMVLFPGGTARMLRIQDVTPFRRAAEVAVVYHVGLVKLPNTAISATADWPREQYPSHETTFRLEVREVIPEIAWHSTLSNQNVLSGC